MSDAGDGVAANGRQNLRTGLRDSLGVPAPVPPTRLGTLTGSCYGEPRHTRDWRTGEFLKKSYFVESF